MVRVTPKKPDRREPAMNKSVKQITRKPKGIKPELQEPKRSPAIKGRLGQSGTRKK